MKPFLILSVFAAAIYSAHPAKAFEVTDLQISGSGCEVPAGGHELIPVAGSSTMVGVPLMINLSKPKTPQLQRVSCMMAMSVSLGVNEKLQISDIRQKVRLKSEVGSQVSTQLEVFLAGQQGTPLKAELAATKKTLRSTQVLNDSGVVAESECGKDVLVRANSSVKIQGAGAGRVNSEAVYMNLQVVSCH